MVMSFFGKGPSGLDHIVARAVSMLGDARHSFDIATLALLTDTDPAAVETDVRKTDTRINETEQELRSALIVHVAVQGTSDIGTVLGLILLLKKIERIGDQAKNVLDLAEAGARLVGEPDTDEMLAERGVISTMFGEVAELLQEPDDDRIDDITTRGLAMMDGHTEKINRFVHSDRPGYEVVPRAIYYRYLKRIVANLLGVVRTHVEPTPMLDYLDDGATDTDD